MNKTGVLTNSSTDIISINEKIKKKLEKRKERIPKLKENLKLLENAQRVSNISETTIKDIEDNISSIAEELYNLENNVDYNFYITQTSDILEKYKQILKKPKIVSFTGKNIPIDNKERDEIIEQFFEIAKNYIDIKINKPENRDNKQTQCEHCNGSDFDIIDNEYICTDCGTVKEKEIENSSYSDVDRVNITVKYSYVRKNHFRDTIYQYQGKQNSPIKEEVYDAIIRECEKNGILVGDISTSKYIRFKNVTKSHISMFLKHLGYNDHYENIHLIHWNLTGKERNDISHLENILLEEFNTLVKLYFTIKKDMKIERKSFINTQHIFYQLLLKHGCRCNKDDFPLLKNIDRIGLRDTICSDMFNILGWKYTSFY